MSSSAVIARSYYFDIAWQDQALALDHIRAAVEGVEFDTFVATGLSGATVAPLAAYVLKKHWLIVRKDDDQSTHSRRRHVGYLGARWVFLDDFISSGATLFRTVRSIRCLTEDDPGFTFVGAVQYERAAFTPVEALLQPPYYGEELAEALGMAPGPTWGLP